MKRMATMGWLVAMGALAGCTSTTTSGAPGGAAPSTRDADRPPAAGSDAGGSHDSGKRSGLEPVTVGIGDLP